MPIHQPQRIQPHERSLDDLPLYIPRYIYKGRQQFREIKQIEFTRYEELNRALIQRYNGQQHMYNHLHQVSYPHYRDCLERLDRRYENSMPRNTFYNTHHSFLPLTQSANAFCSSTVTQYDRTSSDNRHSPESYESGTKRNNLQNFFYNSTPYFIFHISQTLFEKDFLKPESRERFSFFRQNLLLTMAPTEEHGYAAGELTTRITIWVASMNLNSDIAAYIGSGVPAINDQTEIKVPDAAFGPETAPAGFSTRRPSCTVEIGKTQSLTILEDAAKWWLNPAKGAASVCITCKLDTTPRLVIDVWERQVLEGRQAETIRAQHIIITGSKKSNGITIRGSPFHLKFNLLFRRLPRDHTHEHDLVIEDDQLQIIANRIWRHQGLLQD